MQCILAEQYFTKVNNLKKLKDLNDRILKTKQNKIKTYTLYSALRRHKKAIQIFLDFSLVLYNLLQKPWCRLGLFL